jgi:hypothetical protein
MLSDQNDIEVTALPSGEQILGNAERTLTGHSVLAPAAEMSTGRLAACRVI